MFSASLAKADERRRVFSESTRSVLPLLMHVVTEIYGRDVLRQVFTPGAKLCRPCQCLRRLERTTKFRKELRDKEEELSQQVRCLGEANGVHVSESGGSSAVKLTPQKRPAEAEDSPAAKRRAVTFQKSTPVRSNRINYSRRTGSPRRSGPSAT